jgi:hypothetical protein
MLTFGRIGRMSNRFGIINDEPGYVIYDSDGSVFTPAEPLTAETEVVFGDAVEFRYWDVELDEDDTQGLIDMGKIATAYALFYIDGDKLKVDYGPYPPGAVPRGGGSRNTSNIRTIVLAENVTARSSRAFSHTTVAGVGQGCVRINIVIEDPEDNESINVMTASLVRNIWPR